MKKTQIAIAAISAMFLAGCYPKLAPIQPPPPKSSTERFFAFEYKPINTTAPKTKIITLKNGIRVHLLQDKELPIVNALAMIKTGSIWEPESKTGLAILTGAALRSGGTESLKPDALDEKLGAMAASVETSISEESGSAVLSVMSKNLDEGLAIFAGVIKNPRFDNERLELARARMIDAIKRENDDPQTIADRELDKLIYKGSVYGRKATPETVKSIKRKDVVEFYRKHFQPSSVILGFTGDFDEAKLTAKLEKLFGEWKGATQRQAVEHVKDDHAGGIYIANKKLPQAVIRAGHLGVKRTDPDYLAVRVMDEIFGGGSFASRLTQKIRTDKGLAYSVWAYNLAGRWEPGVFMMGVETKTKTAGEALSIFMSEIKRIQTEKVGEAELEDAKNSLINSFVFVFDTPGRILEQRMIIDYYGMPVDYLETYRDKIMKVTADDVIAAANKHLRPKEMKIVAVGDEDGLSEQFKTFGETRKIVLKDYSASH